MILEEYLEIIPVGKNCKYYKDLDYEVHKGVPIQVKIEDVSDGCNTLERIKCDCCGKIETRKHRAIIDTRKAHGKDLCVECSKKHGQKKVKETNLKKYGVEYPMQSKEIKNKAKLTTLEHYGVEFSFQNKEIKEKAITSFKEKYNCENPLQNKEIREKLVQTNLEKYGCENPFGNKEVQEKIKETILEKYGVEYIGQADTTKQKMKETNLEKYGVEHPMQCKEIIEKAIKTRTENDSIPTSKMQLKMYELCKETFPNFLVELNSPLGPLSLDIKLTTDKNEIIDIEYDGWYWHQDKQKDRKRDEVVKKYGYKVIRIRSGGLLPTKEELIKLVNYILDGHNFSRITLKDWKEPEMKNN